jgi:hypothetical protein
LPALRTILESHNALEEAPGGLSEGCEQLVGAEAEALLAQLHAALEVPVAPHADGPHVMDVVRRALARRIQCDPHVGYPMKARSAGGDREIEGTDVEQEARDRSGLLLAFQP